ncbi:MAG: NAD-dependent epimerase/dehydratase family protein [Cytophagales bacterium]|nr:NAD-dependent epimerase/dehydratase family protein [Cytophagales bacterium]
MPKTAFVTGSTGFVGLNLIEELCKEDWEVYALHRPTSDLKYLNRFSVNKVVGSIDDHDSLIAAMPDQVDAVFHVAGNTNMWSKRNKQQYIDNVTGTRNMVNCALAKKAKRFIHTSSVAAFGIHREMIDENTPSNAETSKINYFITKYLGEQEVKKAVSKGLDAVIINPAHIMGPYDKHNWAKLIKTIYYNNLPGIPPGIGMFCHVKDIARAHINAVEKGKTGENYLLGGVEASFKEVINQIEKLLKKKETRKVTPKWALQLACNWYMFVSIFTSKEPQITPETLELLTGNVSCKYDKAIETLDYKTSSLEEMAGDSCRWLEDEQLL